MEYYAIIVEGRTDSAVVEAIICNSLNYRILETVDEVPALFKGLIGSYPVTKKGKIKSLRPEGFPIFAINQSDKSIIIKIANGNQNICKEIENISAALQTSDFIDEFVGFIVFIDSDLKTNEQIEHDLAKALRKLEINWNFKSHILEYNDLQKQLYIYKFPQTGNGAIETLLLNCAKKLYPEIYSKTEKFKQEILEDSAFEIIIKSWTKNEKIVPFYADKMQIECISAVLKPDKPIAMAVKDKIIRNNQKCLQEVDEYRRLECFLENLLK